MQATSLFHICVVLGYCARAYSQCGITFAIVTSLTNEYHFRAIHIAQQNTLYIKGNNCTTTLLYNCKAKIPQFYSFP